MSDEILFEQADFIKKQQRENPRRTEMLPAVALEHQKWEDIISALWYKAERCVQWPETKQHGEDLNNIAKQIRIQIS